MNNVINMIDRNPFKPARAKHIATQKDDPYLDLGNTNGEPIEVPIVKQKKESKFYCAAHELWDPNKRPADLSHKMVPSLGQTLVQEYIQKHLKKG